MNNSSFWPADIDSSLPIPPIQILKRAANELGVVTKGAVIGEVENAGDRYNFNLRLILKAPSLNFSMALCAVMHPIGLYPAMIHMDYWNTKPLQSAEEFESELRDALASEHAKKIIQSLISQSNAIE